MWSHYSLHWVPSGLTRSFTDIVMWKLKILAWSPLTSVGWHLIQGQQCFLQRPMGFVFCFFVLISMFILFSFSGNTAAFSSFLTMQRITSHLHLQLIVCLNPNCLPAAAASGMLIFSLIACFIVCCCLFISAPSPVTLSLRCMNWYCRCIVRDVLLLYTKSSVKSFFSKKLSTKILEKARDPFPNWSWCLKIFYI